MRLLKFGQIKLLMENGANPNFEDFFYAVGYDTSLENHLEIFEDIFFKRWAVDINAQDKNGDTLLHYTVCCDHRAPIIKLVLAKGANVMLGIE